MAELHDQPVAEVIEAQLESTPEPVLVIQPSTTVLKTLIEVVADQDNPPLIRVLAREDTVKQVFDDFLVACRAADAVEQAQLDLRTTESAPGNELFLTDDRLTVFVEAGDTVVGLSTDDADTVEAATDHYLTAWENAEEYPLRMPPLSRIQDTLRTEFNDEIADDFDTLVTSVNSISRTDSRLDDVGVCLLLAAKHGELLYDISKWAEDIGLASKATFSRTKTQLEDHGLLDTEKVPIDVGRPRLRLLLADDELANAAVDDLFPRARQRLEQPATA